LLAKPRKSSKNTDHLKIGNKILKISRETVDLTDLSRSHNNLPENDKDICCSLVEDWSQVTLQQPRPLPVTNFSIPYIKTN